MNDKIYFVAYRVMSVIFWGKSNEALYRRKKLNTFAIMLNKYFVLYIVHIRDSA